MSHTVKIQAHFKSEQLESFKRALSVFGWTTKQKSTIRTYSGDEARSKVYDLIAVNPQPGYDLGLVFNDKTGELEVMGDFYDGSVAKSLGSGLDRLKQEYSLAVIEDKFAFDGYVSTRELANDGSISIIGEKNA